MTALSRTSWPVFFLLVACATTSKQTATTISPPTPSSASTAVEQPEQAPAPLQASGLYTVHEALKDVLVGDWTYLGTGPWPGNNRLHACVYHNGNVFIVDVYCTITESHAFRVDILSPSRGRLRIYAEANGPISSVSRDAYFIFSVESEPPPPANTLVLPLSLSMSLADMQRYESSRYDAYLPACYLGIRHGEVRGGCLDKYADAKESFRAEHQRFIDEPDATYFQLLKILRKQALRFGYDPR